jgi:predicted NBD/HSP70 family sugar kinase
VIQARADYRWSQQPDIAAWLERSRLNALRGMLKRAANDARVREGLQRYVKYVAAGLKNLETMIAAADARL